MITKDILFIFSLISLCMASLFMIDKLIQLSVMFIAVSFITFYISINLEGD